MKQFYKLIVGLLSVSLLAACDANPENQVPEEEPKEQEQEPAPQPGGDDGGETQHTHTLVHDYGRPATFFYEGVIEHYHCSGCDKNFNATGEELDSVVIPKLSTDLALGVNGVIACDFVTTTYPDQDSYITWNIASISLHKDDVISICKKGDASVTYDYFPNTQSNITSDYKVHNDVDNGQVSIEGTPNGLHVSISGFELDGIVIQINNSLYPMEQVTYLDSDVETYIYGYAYIAQNDVVKVIDKDNNIVYDYDDLASDSTWNTYDFHRNADGEIVFDYAARYGFEFDRGGDKKLSVTKSFGPNHTTSVAVNFNSERADVTLSDMAVPSTSELYKQTMWYIEHEKVINNSDIVSYIQSSGLHLYQGEMSLVANEEFNISDLTNNKVINADHLVSLNVTNPSTSMIVNGNYIKALKSIYVGLYYMPSIDSIVVYEQPAPSTGAVLYYNGAFINLTPDSNNIASYEIEVTSDYGEIIMLTDSSYSPLDVSIDPTGDTTHITKGSNGMFTLTTKGTYNLHLNVSTLVLKVDFTPASAPQTDKIYKLYDTNTSEHVFSNAFVVNPNNSQEWCLLNYTVTYGWLALVDYTSGSMETIEDATLSEGSEIATAVSYFYIVQAGKTINFYYNPTAKTVRITEVI